MSESRTVTGLIALLALLTFPALAAGALSLPEIFGEGMVLQRQRPIRVWGTAEADQRVRVRLADRSASTTADGEGAWRVEFEPMAAGGPHELTVTAGEQSLTRRDVLIGEVWLLSGQSNMAMGLKGVTAAEKRAATNGADLPRLRLNRDWPDEGHAWRASNEANALNFSAIGYMFGRRIHRQLDDVPVGLILRARGGTMIQSLISDEGLRRDPIVRQRITDRWDRYRSRYEQIQARVARRPSHARPANLADPQGSNAPSNQFREKIAPLIPYPLRGAVWYQGESDAWGFPIASGYERMLGALIEDWRRQWRDPSMYFAIVQLANYQPSEQDPPVVTGPWALVQEAQAKVAEDVNVGLAVAIDSEAETIHPRRKRDAARRAADCALNDVYGHDVASRGPRPRAITIHGNEAHVRLDHAEGLHARGGEVSGVIIAGADRRFHHAEARIEGRTLIASSPRVPAPVAVRYAFWEASPYSLYNGAGLPAGPFRTDDWSWDIPAKGTPAVTGRQAKQPPTIDGKLDDAAWENAAAATGFHVQHTYAQAPATTRTRVAWDDDALYLGFRCESEAVGGLDNAAKRRDDRALWVGDYVEAVVDVDLDDRHYHRFAVTPDGTIYDAKGFFDPAIRDDILWQGMLKMYRDLDAKWNPKWRVGTGRVDGAWVAELAIPWAALGGEAPEAGATLKLQLARRFGADGPVVNWARTGRGYSTGAMMPPRMTGRFQRYHEPDRFGALTLVE